MKRRATAVARLAVLWLGIGTIPAGALDDDEMKTCIELFEQQASQATEPEKNEQKTVRGEREAYRSQGGVGDVGPKMQTSVDLVAGEADGRGVLTYAGTVATTGGQSSSWAISVNVPFDKSKKEATFVSLAGLSGDIVASAERNWFRWKLNPTSYGEKLCRQCDAEGLSLLECSLDGLRKHWLKPTPPVPPLPRSVLDGIDAKVEAKATALRGALETACRDQRQAEPLIECSANGLKRLWKEELVARAEKEAAAAHAAAHEPDLELKEAVEERILRIQDALFGGSRLWGVKIAGARKPRTYFELDGDKREEDRIGYEASVMGGLALSDGTVYARLIGKRDFKENDKATQCSAIEDSELETCIELPLREAREVESLVTTLEWRRFFKTLAMAPGAAYDFETEEWTAQLPIFLFRNEKEAFTGGFKLLWSSEQDELTAGVFVSKALQP